MSSDVVVVIGAGGNRPGHRPPAGRRPHRPARRLQPARPGRGQEEPGGRRAHGVRPSRRRLLPRIGPRPGPGRGRARPGGERGQHRRPAPRPGAARGDPRHRPGRRRPGLRGVRGRHRPRRRGPGHLLHGRPHATPAGPGNRPPARPDPRRRPPVPAGAQRAGGAQLRYRLRHLQAGQPRPRPGRRGHLGRARGPGETPPAPASS
jgi:hypothetical protein